MKKSERTLTDKDLKEIEVIFDTALNPLSIKLQAFIYILAENFVTTDEFEKLQKRLSELEERMYD